MTKRGPNRGRSRLADVAPVMTPTENGHEGQPTLHGRVVQRALEVVGQGKERPQHGDSHEERRQEGASPVPIEDDAQREQRVRGPALDEHERREQDSRDPEERERRRRSPTVQTRLGEGVDQGQEPAGDRDRTRDVIAVTHGTPALGHEASRQKWPPRWRWVR